jgi:hypothetical protein
VNPRLKIVAAAVVAAVVLFQFFGRYSYTYYHGVAIQRMDRLTGEICRVPCVPPTPTPIPTEAPTPNLELEDQRAIELVEYRRDALARVAEIVQQSNAQEYRWRVLGRYTNSGEQQRQGLDVEAFERDNGIAEPMPTHPYPKIYPVRVVWYASQRHGYAWEAHLDTNEVFSVSGNAALEAKYYGAPSPAPQR